MLPTNDGLIFNMEKAMHVITMLTKRKAVIAAIIFLPEGKSEEVGIAYMAPAEDKATINAIENMIRNLKPAHRTETTDINHAE